MVLPATDLHPCCPSSGSQLRGRHNLSRVQIGANASDLVRFSDAMASGGGVVEFQPLSCQYSANDILSYKSLILLGHVVEPTTTLLVCQHWLRRVSSHLSGARCCFHAVSDWGFARMRSLLRNRRVSRILGSTLTGRMTA